MSVVILAVIFVVLLTLGCPIAWTMIIASLGYILMEPDVLVLAIPRRMAGSLQSFPLLAVPFFILAANLLNNLGITKKIFDFALALIGHVKGGLGLVNILASMIFAGMSGSTSADAAGLGTIEIKAMVDEGYERPFSAAITAASSVVGPIIPPSISLVVYGVMAEVSTGWLFAAGLLPGVTVGGVLMLFVYWMARRGIVKAPIRRERASLKRILKTGVISFWALLTPLIIVFSIIWGIVTPSEAGAIACAYAIILGLIYGEFSISKVVKAFNETIVPVGFIMFLIAGAAIFGWEIALEKIPEAFARLILFITPNKILILAMLNGFLLVMGCFLPGVEALILVTPIVLVLAEQIGIDLVHLGVILVLNLIIGLVTPPVALCLYITSGIAGCSFEETARAVLPYLLALVIALFIITYFPSISLFLPELLLGK